MSLEQFQPDVALDHAILVDKAGFESIWASDHFLPWFHTNAASSFAWVWIGAAAQATRSTIRLGTGLTCPSFRYHPALVAQAFATMDHMYPNRFFLSVGTGEALNEKPLGYRWPSYKERVGRLEEAIQIIRMLWNGEEEEKEKENVHTFKSSGNYFTLRKEARRLYTLPRGKIPIYVAASGPTVSEVAGRLGDGLLTPPSASDSTFKDVIFPAVKKGLKASERSWDEFERHVEVWMSFDQEDYDRALRAVRPWAGSILPVFYKLGVSDPREIEMHGNLVGDEQLSKVWIIGTSSDPFIKAIERYSNLGFTGIHVTSSSPDQGKFIELFRKEVLPYFKEEEEEEEEENKV